MNIIYVLEKETHYSYALVGENQKARMIGRLAGEILGDKGIEKGIKILEESSKSGVLSKVVLNAKSRSKADDVVRMLEGAAEATAKVRNYIVNAVEDALTEFRKIVRSGDYITVEYADPFGNIIKEKIPCNEINQSYISKIDEVAGFTNKIEQVLDKMKTYEQARNKALEIVGDLGYDSKPYVGRLGTGEGKIVGRQSADGKARWRLDYDPEKGPHINVEDFRKGKGTSATKIAIPFEGDINTIETLLKVLNK